MREGLSREAPMPPTPEPAKASKPFEVDISRSDSAAKAPGQRQRPSIPQQPDQRLTAPQSAQTRMPAAHRSTVSPAEPTGVHIGTLDIRIEAAEQPAAPVAAKPTRETSVASRRYIRRG